jgi:hypothetical protein
LLAPTSGPTQDLLLEKKKQVSAEADDGWLIGSIIHVDVGRWEANQSWNNERRWTPGERWEKDATTVWWVCACIGGSFSCARTAQGTKGLTKNASSWGPMAVAGAGESSWDWEAIKVKSIGGSAAKANGNEGRTRATVEVDACNCNVI